MCSQSPSLCRPPSSSVHCWFETHFILKVMAHLPVPVRCHFFLSPIVRLLAFVFLLILLQESPFCLRTQYIHAETGVSSNSGYNSRFRCVYLDVPPVRENSHPFIPSQQLPGFPAPPRAARDSLFRKYLQTGAKLSSVKSMKMKICCPANRSASTKPARRA